MIISALLKPTERKILDFFAQLPPGQWIRQCDFLNFTGTNCENHYRKALSRLAGLGLIEKIKDRGHVAYRFLGNVEPVAVEPSDEGQFTGNLPVIYPKLTGNLPVIYPQFTGNLPVNDPQKSAQLNINLNKQTNKQKDFEFSNSLALTLEANPSSEEEEPLNTSRSAEAVDRLDSPVSTAPHLSPVETLPVATQSPQRANASPKRPKPQTMPEVRQLTKFDVDAMDQKWCFDGSVYAADLDRGEYLSRMTAHFSDIDYEVPKAVLERVRGNPLLDTAPHEYFAAAVATAAALVYKGKNGDYLAKHCEAVYEEINHRLAFAIAKGAEELAGPVERREFFQDISTETAKKFRSQLLFKLRWIYYRYGWGWDSKVLNSPDTYNAAATRFEPEYLRQICPIYSRTRREIARRYAVEERKKADDAARKAELDARLAKQSAQPASSRASPEPTGKTDYHKLFPALFAPDT